MLFHTCHFFCGGKEAVRKDWNEVDPFTEVSASFYSERKIVKNASLDAVNETSAFRGRIQCISSYGPAIYDICMPGVVGAACLYLPGRTPFVEQQYCKKMQQKIAGLPFLLGINFDLIFPIPPLEIVTRPLMFYVIFNLAGDNDDLYISSTPELLLWVNGIGLSMLRQTSKKR